MQSGASALSDRKSGQMNLFAEGGESEAESDVVDLPEIPEMEERQLLAAEKEVLGYYLTSHPLAQHRELLSRYCSHSTRQVGQTRDRDRVTMGGMISSVKHSHVKRVRDVNSPTKYVMFDLEDVDGAIRCIQWPTEFAEQGELIQPDAIVVVQGSIDRRGGGDEANLVIDRVIPLDEIDQCLTTGIKIRMQESLHEQSDLKAIYEIIRGYPGKGVLQLQLTLTDGVEVSLAVNKMKVDINQQLCQRLEERLGKGALEMVVDRTSLSSKAPPQKRWSSRSG